MDTRAWRTAVHGVTRVEHDLANKHHPSHPSASHRPPDQGTGSANKAGKDSPLSDTSPA